MAYLLVGYNIITTGITEIELLSNSKLTKKGIATIKNLLSEIQVIDTLSGAIKERAAFYRRNKIVKKTPDAIIAATAFCHNLILITADKDFESISEIDTLILDI